MLAQTICFILISFNSFILGGILRKITLKSPSYYFDFLLGFAVFNAITTLVSISFPINELATITVLAFNVLLYLVNYKWFNEYFRGIVTSSMNLFRKKYLIIFISSVFLIICFSYSLYPASLHYDAGLYHIQNIRWIYEYPAIPGLAHINYLFGYNFNTFTLNAATSLPSFFGQPIYATNLTLSLFFIIWTSFQLQKSLNDRKYLTSIGHLIIFYCFILFFYPHISSPSNNLPIFIIVLSILIPVFQNNYISKYGIYALILSVYVVTVKLSSVPIIIFALYLFISVIKINTLKQNILMTSLGSLILVPWLVKNIIQTGWILFPFSQFDFFSFDWKIPVNKVIETQSIIKDFVKGKSENNWIVEWFVNQDLGNSIVLWLSIISLLAILFRSLVLKIVPSKLHLMFLLTAISSIFYMFILAPSPIYIMPFLSGLIFYATASYDNSSLKLKYFFYSIWIFSAAYFIKLNWFHPWHFIKNIENRFILPYPVENTTIKYSYFLIDNKIKCYYPTNSNQCYEPMFPCSIGVRTDIHLRGSSIKDGFYDGSESSTEK